MPRELRPDRNIAVGRRLKLARLAFDFSGKGGQGRFAVGAGFKANRYNQWETGERYPPAEDVTELCSKYVGLTLDWVYRGKMDGMPHWLTKRLDDLMAGDPMPTPAPPPLIVPVVPAPKTTKIVKVSAARRRRAS